MGVQVEVITTTSSKADFIKRTVEQGSFAAQVLEELKTKMQDNNIAVPDSLKLGGGGNTVLETVNPPTPVPATTAPPAEEKTYAERAAEAWEKAKKAAAKIPIAAIAGAVAAVLVIALIVYRRRRQRRARDDPLKSSQVAEEL